MKSRSQWYNSGPASVPEGATPPATNQPEMIMSADKDRGIRRQKQKRAKDKKKQAQQPPKPASVSAAHS